MKGDFGGGEGGRERDPELKRLIDQNARHSTKNIITLYPFTYISYLFCVFVATPGQNQTNGLLRRGQWPAKFNEVT